MARDKLMHAAMGAITALGVLALLLIAKHIGKDAAMVTGAIAVGLAYEGIQKLRNAGEPDLVDAAATALGGVALTVGAWLIGWV